MIKYLLAVTALLITSAPATAGNWVKVFRYSNGDTRQVDLTSLEERGGWMNAKQRNFGGYGSEDCGIEYSVSAHCSKRQLKEQDEPLLIQYRDGEWWQDFAVEDGT